MNDYECGKNYHFRSRQISSKKKSRKMKNNFAIQEASCLSYSWEETTFWKANTVTAIHEIRLRFSILLFNNFKQITLDLLY